MLSVKQERRAVQQSPREVLRHFEAVGRALELHGGLLLLGRRAAEATQVNFLDELLVVLLRVGQLGNAAVRRVDGLADGVSVHKAERVRKGHVAGALALAGALAFGASEEK